MSLVLAPFIDAFVSAAQQMLGQTPTARTSTVSHPWKVHGDMAVQFALHSADRSYYIVMTVTTATAVKFVEAVLGTTVEFEADLVADTVAEVFNMAVGMAQAHSTQRFTFTVPVISKGKGHMMTALESTFVEAAEFELFGDTVGVHLVDVTASSDSHLDRRGKP
ncbi:chemotaxis protein CheX [Novosphingobium sp.]|uniref:chemotaxis protein CheX n=1 Tax=Novosphingobium sp. TaxID=1874826 RepID=UPI003D118B17